MLDRDGVVESLIYGPKLMDWSGVSLLTVENVLECFSGCCWRWGID